MKMIQIILLFLSVVFTSCESTNTSNRPTSIQSTDTVATYRICSTTLDSLQFDFCEELSVEFVCLYDTINSIPVHTDESFEADDLLTSAGFLRQNYGWGNWPLGPRIISIHYTKDSCDCHLMKKCFFHGEDSSGVVFEVRITEQIICNTEITSHLYD